MSKRIEISFVETQETNIAQRVVLVLDVSHSMQNYGRLVFTKEALTRYVNGTANNSRRLAILAFSENAYVVHPLAPVNADTRPGFLSAIKRLRPQGPTCIGCGLRKAVAHLNTSGETTEGAVIVLLSDGEGNTGPDIESVMPGLLEAKVVVSTLAVGGTAAEKLEKLASETRGKAYAFQDKQGNIALEMDSAFVEATAPSLEQASREQTLVNTMESLDRLLERPFQVDSGVGKETVVYVTVNDRRKAQIQARLVDPSGQQCQACNETSTAEGIAIFVPSPAEVGTWILHLSSSGKVEVNIQVKSKARKEGVEPIQVSCTMANMLVDRPDAAVVYVKISRGKKVALGASVLAEVQGPKPPHQSTLVLHDDGREPDNHAGDGTYSGYFTKFDGKGRYTVTARVLHQNGTRLAYPVDSSACGFGMAMHTASDQGTVAGASLDFASEHPIDDFKLVNTTTIATTDNATSIEFVDPFERVASGGSFQVTEPIFESHVLPGTIRDLAAADVHPGENGTLLVELTFTWPGTHLTSGKASSVEIRASKDYAKLTSDFGSQTKIAEFNATEPSLEHVFVVSLPSFLATPQQDGASRWNAYVAARAANKDGLKSNTSNVVPLDYTTPLLSTTVATTTVTTSEATSTAAATKTTTTNAATTTAEITTTTERATTTFLTTIPRPSTTEATPSRDTIGMSTTAPSTKRPVISPLPTTEITTTTERATTNFLTTILRPSTTEATPSRDTVGMSTTAPSTKRPVTSPLPTTTLYPTTISTTAKERSLEETTTTEASTVFHLPSNVNMHHSARVGAPSLTIFLTLSKWVPIGGAISAAVVAILYALIINIKRKNQRNYRRSFRRARKAQKASA
ncbi:calcium-activated chloride channel regulator 3A-1-like [Dermacentor albipictus]|uniref:calcium-activated chloride channel regulator 3A-1-like n=1 Tax=Dermacentor albipictus TaxID=60249 RepID=UPI0038FC56DC